MNGKAHGQLRRSQVITTFGPGALIDLPDESAIVGGLDTWGAETRLEPIEEPRLASKLTSMTGVHDPRLYAPPAGAGPPSGPATRNRRVAVPGVVRGAGIQPRLGGTGRLAFPAHGAADGARSRQV